MDIEKRLNSISEKIHELDSLIGDALDNEPDSERGNYGKRIQALFSDTNWIDVVIISE